MQADMMGDPAGRAEIQRRSRLSRRSQQRSSTLGVMVAIVGLLVALIWALNLETRLPALRIAEQPPAGTTQKILEPGSFKADDPAIARTGNWFTQTLGSTATASTSASQVTSTAGSEMTLRFYGTDISMNARIGPESGEVNVTVDGGTSSVLPSDSFG